MEPIIKKKIKNLIIVSLSTALITSVLTVGVWHTYSELQLKDVSSLSQIDDYQEEFGVVDGYQHTNGERLKHNGGEPIYIQIHNGFSSEQKATIQRALDYIFGLVGDINDNYKYVIVDDLNQKEYSNKTKIHFYMQDSVRFNDQEVYGLYKTYLHGFKSKSKGVFINKGDIYMEKSNASDPDELYNTTLHEIFHLFGVKDVYFSWVGERYNNTYINVNGNRNLKMLSPNDYKLLISLYAKNTNELDESEKQDYINQLEQKIEDYTVKYYSHYQQAYKQKLLDDGLSEETVKERTSYVQLENDIDVTFVDTIRTKGISTIRVKVKDSKYVVATYDENNNMLESCSGKAYNVGGQIFLHNVILKNLNRGDSTYADLCVEMRTDNTKYYRLSDTLDTIYSGAGMNTDYYLQQNPELGE